MWNTHKSYEQVHDINQKYSNYKKLFEANSSVLNDSF